MISSQTKIHISPNSSKQDQEIIDKGDLEDLFYNNQNIFNLVFIEAENSFSNLLEIGKRTKVEYEDYDPEEGTTFNYENVKIDGQESYLGYSPKEDLFISGWDMWVGDDNPAGIIKFKIENGKIHILKSETLYQFNIIYGKHGAYKNYIKINYTDILDLRLD